MARALVTGGTHGIGEAIAQELRSLGHDTFTPSRTVGYDLTKMSDVERAISDAGDVDILVNNVGGGGRYGDDSEVLRKNIGATMYCSELVLPHMLECKWGRVITISSIHGRECGSRPIFMAAKAAQIAWMKGMSRNKEYVRRGLTFNTVCPGNVYVEGKPRVEEEALPMGRMGKPEEVAKLVAFLCSDDAAWINGSTITIDGGESVAI